MPDTFIKKAQPVEVTSTAESYNSVRRRTENLCRSLETEDYVIQPADFVSPPKWHLAHTTWFFETFLLKPYAPNYREFHPRYNFLFNSYYNSVGDRVLRQNRGYLSRPTVADVFAYRKWVDEAMAEWLSVSTLNEDQKNILEIGLNHEQQHQELLITDIKYILGHNPLFPPYNNNLVNEQQQNRETGWLEVPAGLYEIGHRGNDFAYDNESPVHNVFVNDFSISKNLVSQGDFAEFVEAGGYKDFTLWHADGWTWVQEQGSNSPLYWHKIDDEWHRYSLNGLVKLEPELPVMHVNFFEAAAYARFRGLRLPTEFEWEIAAKNLNWGSRWEWTNSAYLPYPGYAPAEGALGEYNGKFMLNQMVLRGASVATSPGHQRITYRNFFQPEHQWQYSGIRLAK